MVASDQQLVHTPFVPAAYWSPCAPLIWDPVKAPDIRFSSSHFRKQHPHHEKAVISGNANSSLLRLEEREQDLRSELSAQNERYTKLLKIYVDYIETNNLSVSNNDIESGTVCVGCEKDTESNELVMKSTANSNSTNENPNQISVESGYILNTNSKNHDISTIGIDLTHPLESEPGVNALHSLDSSLKSNNGTTSFIDIYDDIVDYETALESTPAMGTGDDVEEIGMIKEVEKLIKENTDLYETKNALNVLKDDLIKKLDEVTGEKSMLIQEIHAIRTNRDEIKSEASRLSRLVYECRDQISSLTARLKIYEDVNEADQRSSRLLLTSIQQSKSCWTLNAESTCHTSPKYRNKSVDNLNDVSPLNDMNKTEDGYDLQSTFNKVPKFGEAFFTKREMARVIAERNSYKEKFLELQDAMRLMERLRVDHNSRLQFSTGDGFERWVPRSFFSTVQSGLTGLFSTFDQAVPLASVLPSEAQCLSPYQLSVQYMNSSSNGRRKSVGLRNIGKTIIYGRDNQKRVSDFKITAPISIPKAHVWSINVHSKEDFKVERLQQMGLLKSSFICDCGAQMTAGHCTDYCDDVVFRCNIC
ncbi:unnamed protein product [Schistosoma margrebowiei]|uniref:Uncharacterized protein n=1 Tax=Schistosoma margrebowiei TaxID=48269 RepID=A0A183MVX3_9TREM|nr:unnamed protein product [Schistosoma margrebowiei]